MKITKEERLGLIPADLVLQKMKPKTERQLTHASLVTGN
jgi:hypothetical protein